MMQEVMKAAEMLAAQGVNARVESCHTIKPLDQGMLAQVFSQYTLVAVIEEHSRIGGLTGAVAEWLVQQKGATAKLLSFGMDDEFMHEVGTQEYARKRYGLTAENIARRIFSRLEKNSA
jgi:transketolase